MKNWKCSGHKKKLTTNVKMIVFEFMLNLYLYSKPADQKVMKTN